MPRKVPNVATPHLTNRTLLFFSWIGMIGASSFASQLHEPNEAFQLWFRVLSLLYAIWLGCLISISFMEAWLKFKTPSSKSESARPILFDIGRHVFWGLNRIEIILSGTSLGIFGAFVERWSSPMQITLLIPCVALFLQVLHLQPILDQSARHFISGKEKIPGYHHAFYIILEIVKLSSLIYFQTLRI